MIRLNSTLRKLQVLLAGAVTTNQLPVLVSYSDKTATQYDGATQVANTSGTTPVDICDVPGASTIRDIDYISVRNSDTAAATVTIRYNDNATLYTIVTATLAVGDHLTYVHGSGWNVTSSAGAIRTIGTSVTASDTTFSPTGGIASTNVQAAIAELDTEKANLAGPTFTGTVTIPTPFTLGAVSVLPTGTELNFVDGVTSNIQTQLDAKANLAGPTFTGTVTIPTPFTLGAVSVLPTGTELNFVDGVTSNIQTQIDGKVGSASPTITGTATFSGEVVVGDIGSEAAGININGTVYPAISVVSAIGGTATPQIHIHRHSTSVAPALLFSRTNSNDSTHGAVSAAIELGSIQWVGTAGSNYKSFAKIRVFPGAGTISGTSSPGKIIFQVTPDGSVTPADAVTLDSDKSVLFAGNILPTDGTTDLGAAANKLKRLYADYTNTATVGAVTINKMSGRVNIAASGTTVTVTNSLVTAASHVFVVVSQNDATAQVKSVVPAAGSFVINTTACTAQTSFDFLVINAD